jgi:hypothetical protein
VEFVLADLGFCVPLWSLCCLILVFVFLCGVCVGCSHKLCKGTQKPRSDNTNSAKEHKNQDQPTQTPQRNTKTKISQHKLCKGTQKPRSDNTNFKKEHKNQDQTTQTPQRNTKTKISQHKLCKGTQKPRSANTNSTKEHKNQDQPTQTPQRNTKTKISQHKLCKGTQKPVFVFLCRVCVGWSWFLCSFVEFVLADLGFCVPLQSLCCLILVFVFLCGVCVS